MNFHSKGGRFDPPIAQLLYNCCIDKKKKKTKKIDLRNKKNKNTKNKVHVPRQL